jgi:hypothetical protein
MRRPLRQAQGERVLLACAVAVFLAAAPARGATAPPALSTVADALAKELGPPTDGRRALALAVETRAPALAAPLEAALEAALARRGYAITPAGGQADPERAARAAGQDWLLRVQGGLVPGRREIALVAEAIPAWESFFLQRRPGARPVPPRLVQARAPADPETQLLAREGRPPGAPFAVIRSLARIPGRVLALAVGEVEPGTPAIVAATPDSVILLSARGAPIARRELDPAARRPIRDPAATLAVGDFGGGRIAVFHAGAEHGEVLSPRGDRLEPVGTLDAAPLCATDGVRLFGAFAPGKGVLQDLISPAIVPNAPPRSARELYGVAAAPHGGPIAFAALGTDLRLELLGADLRAATVAPSPRPSPPRSGGEGGSMVDGIGSGFALADLDGDGVAEVIASSPVPGETDRIRILAPRAEVRLLLESPPVQGAILAGAAGDLTGDGVDDALLAAVSRGEDGALWTELLLVTADPREVP